MIAIAVSDERRLIDAGSFDDPRHLVNVHVNGHARLFAQLDDARNMLLADQRPANVVGVVVGRHRAHELHAIDVEHLDQLRRPIRRINQHCLTSSSVTNRVREVAHRQRHGVAHREITAGE